MNIFITDDHPTLCAIILDDLRLNKMIVETAQMLCTAYRRLFDYDHVNDILYKDAYINHPCTQWTYKHFINYYWLVNYFDKLLAERERRFNTKHATGIKLLDILYNIELFSNYDIGVPSDVQFTFNCSMHYPSTGNVHNDYRICMLNKWIKDKRQPKWTNRENPKWINISNEHLYNIRSEYKRLNQFEQAVYVRAIICSDIIKHVD